MRDRRRRHQGRRARRRRLDVRLHHRRSAGATPRAPTGRRTRSGPATGCCCPARSASTAPRSCSRAASSSWTRRSSRTRARCGRSSTRCWTRPDPSLRCMRDATRGGVASVLNELARASQRGDARARGGRADRPGGGRGLRDPGDRPDVRGQRGQARRLRGRGSRGRGHSARCARCRAASAPPRSARCAPSRPGWSWWRRALAASG